MLSWEEVGGAWQVGQQWQLKEVTLTPLALITRKSGVEIGNGDTPDHTRKETIKGSTRKYQGFVKEWSESEERRLVAVDIHL